MCCATAVAAGSVTAIQDTGPAPALPKFIGSAARPQPLPGVGGPHASAGWQDPFMAPNPSNSVHNDAWQSDDYTTLSGPLGRRPQTLSTAIGRDCITLTFNSKGQLLEHLLGPDPRAGPLPTRRADPHDARLQAASDTCRHRPALHPALNTTGGAYFYLDNHDRVVVAASNDHILVIALRENHGRPTFKQVADYNPIRCLSPGDRIPSVLPDAQGRIWFVGRYQGAVGVLDPKTGRCRSVILHQQIENSFAVASDGVYIVTDKAMYKFRAGANLVPRSGSGACAIATSACMKTGQFNAGSGTTPTLVGPTGGSGAGANPAYVAITDNADPMDVVVYRTSDRLARGQRRVVCQVPVFRKGAQRRRELADLDRSFADRSRTTTATTYRS